MNQYITESASNLSTDMALVLSKHFLRTISQPQKESTSKQSLWSLADVEKAQAKQREIALAEAEAEEIAKQGRESNGGGLGMQGMGRLNMDADLSDDDDEFGSFGIDDANLAKMDLDG